MRACQLFDSLKISDFYHIFCPPPYGVDVSQCDPCEFIARQVHKHFGVYFTRVAWFFFLVFHIGFWSGRASEDQPYQLKGLELCRSVTLVNSLWDKCINTLVCISQEPLDFLSCFCFLLDFGVVEPQRTNPIN